MRFGLRGSAKWETLARTNARHTRPMSALGADLPNSASATSRARLQKLSPGATTRMRTGAAPGPNGAGRAPPGVAGDTGTVRAVTEVGGAGTEVGADSDGASAVGGTGVGGTETAEEGDVAVE